MESWEMLAQQERERGNEKLGCHLDLESAALFPDSLRDLLCSHGNAEQELLKEAQLSPGYQN